MGKRKYQRVVLTLGLLFLTIIICCFILTALIIQQQTERNRIIGRLITNHPEMELELIDIFENPDNDSIHNDVIAGRNLLEKYGYTGEYLRTMRVDVYYIVGVLLVLITGTVLIGGILYYYDHKHNRYELDEERMKEQLREFEKGNRVLLEKLTLEEKNTKELITDISHQLKTPLASLKMSYEITQSEDFTAEERNMFLRQGREELNKLEVLLEALLNIARLEKGMIQMKPSALSLMKTLIGAVNSVYMKAHDKQIDIVMEEFEDLNVMHDTKWTQEALVNVLDNAIKYSDPSTSIHIKVSIMVTYVVVEIADEGIGIPVKDYPNIFKRFYRGHSEIVQNTEGSGVGLYLVRKILEEQGGTVCVKQGVSCGSIFLLTIQKA